MNTFVLKPDPVANVSVVVSTVFIFYLYFHHSNEEREGHLSACPLCFSPRNYVEFPTCVHIR